MNTRTLAYRTARETTSMTLTAQQQQTQMIRSLRQPIVRCLVPAKQELRIREETPEPRGQQTLGAQAAHRLHQARGDAVLDTLRLNASLIRPIKDVQQNAFGGVRDNLCACSGVSTFADPNAV